LTRIETKQQPQTCSDPRRIGASFGERAAHRPAADPCHATVVVQVRIAACYLCAVHVHKILLAGIDTIIETKQERRNFLADERREDLRGADMAAPI
jgi:hypothetical protein